MGLQLNTLIKIVGINKEDLQTSKTLRDELKVDSKCQIYSRATNKMFSGTVARIFTDKEGEWLEVQYGTRQKQIPRDSKDLHISETLRNELRVGSECEIYSREKNKTFPGKVVRIFTDNEGEWLEVQYGTRQKQIPRDRKDLHISEILRTELKVGSK
eukprot:23615_1